MNHRPPHRAAFASLLFSAILIHYLFPAAPMARPAQREHLTPQEIELVRDTQELDRRTDVFIKAVERRVLLLTDPPAAEKQAQKDAEKWGELPKSTRTQLFSDIARILDEAVTNIDDAAVRSPKSSLLPKSLRKLADACARFLPQLTPMRDRAQDELERDRLEQAIENAQEVVGAANKLPPPEKK